ncbi:insulin receptor substrate 1 isoform X2 [Anoplophora glabripennis]|uniref:insulin receptor substrate 1 isoform X2 n=1 Tax=Anoplophora glabripennis TaxID=217634 RepID=UPI000C75F51B|nr:insulin receptor substrate 1 isoform X2 [Anoplophora glabripennis]
MSVKSFDPSQGGEVVRCGLLKKFKTSRKKWFVLRAETPESSARLEYYDSEKKFNNGLPPKRSIPLRTCFNINRRNDTKYKHVIALYTKDDCFCVVLESEEDLDVWLKDLLSLQHGEEAVDGETPRPTFEHVWQVTLLNRGLGTNRIGPYRLCLTDKTLTLIKKDENGVLDLQLTNIRSCGSLRNYFFLEVGRSSHLGAGELWMDSDDPNIAQNIHTTIFHAMTTNTKKEELEPRSRVRSSSATESSKPNNAVNRTRQGASGVQRTHVFSQDNPNTSTTIETQTQVVPVSNNTVTAAAPHSIGGGATWSGNICHQRTQSLPLTAHPTTNAPLTDNTPLHPSSTRAPTTSAKRSNQSSKCIMGGRERCDSMPSRPRTTSEGTHPIPTWRLITSHHRSHGRDISHSPPSGSPVSPPSVGCSTDSTGSSYSLTDEVDVCTECPEPIRYSMPLTPDEAIAEEDCPESPCGIYESYVPMAPPSSDDGYVDMSPRCPHNATSPTVSMSSVTSGTPSTDIRFSDYPLDKVSSYFASEDDDARPARAYSVGSRPETCRSKRHIELAGTPENARVRAFSVGSKTKKGPTRVLPPHYPHAGAKSSSAPLLSNYRTHSSHSSIGPMDDLMEMDFSRSNTGSSTNSGYMEMKPGVAKIPSGYVEMKPGVDLRNAKSDVSPYVDMSGSSPARNNIASPQEEYNSFVDMRQYHRLSSHEQARNNNYMDMDQRKYRTHSTSSNTRVSTSPSSYHWNDYMDMSGNQPKRSERGSFSSQLSSSPNVPSVSPKNGDYSPLNLYSQDSAKPSENQTKTPEGYVEMTPGSVKHQRQSSLDSTQVIRGNEDYTNMSLGLGAAKKKMIAKKEKARSQPISINSTTAGSQVTKNSSSPISVSSLLGRKSSTGTPPRMHLPISSWSTSPYSSLPRQKPRKDSNSNSKDSSSSSITTPSSSSTIFPMSLNSPSSPMKPPSKTETPSALKLPAALLNAIYKTNNKSAVARPAAEDYTVMDFETNKNKSVKMDDIPSDYVNYSPAAKTPIVIPSKVELMDETPGDYAVMKPGMIEARTMNLPLQNTSSSGNTSPLVIDLSCIGIDETQAKVFRPIKEDVRLGSSSPRPGDVVPTKLSEDSRTTGTATAQGVESPYETWRSTECVSPAAKISRPNSVNSDAINSTSPRPNLGSNEKSRPSSVASDTSKGATSRPSSTSSELCSSSSTLLGSRPESVNSDQIRPDSAAGQPVTVKTDIQLHYARLDLAQAEEDGSRSPRTTKSSPGDAASQTQCEPAFFYAEIDFKKSEGLKHSNQSLPSNAKVQH